MRASRVGATTPLPLQVLNEMTTRTLYAPTPLVGREADLNFSLSRILDPAEHVLTVTGPVGVGKSRLVGAAFDSARHDFAHGGQLLDLSSVEEPARLRCMLAAAVSAGTSPEPEPASWEDEPEPASWEEQALPSERHFLLALDGCDHLSDALAPLITTLIRRSPRLTVLIAGVAPLGIYGELLIRLATLPVPDPALTDDPAELEQVPSVRMFVHRARAVRPGFSLNRGNLQVVAELCTRLDGLPLAIELAAARLKLYSPQTLLARLDSDLDLLCGTAADTMSQHLSMRSAIEWSCKRLNPTEQIFLNRLSVFSGQFRLDAAQLMNPDADDDVQALLESLVDKNILEAEERSDGEVGFRLLRLIRNYALERLHRSDDLAETKRRHASHVISFVDAAESGSAGPRQAWWLDNTRDHYADIEPAFRFLLDAGEVTAATHLVTRLRIYWIVRGPLRECVRLLELAVEAGERSGACAAEGMEMLGAALIEMGKQSRAHECLTRARDHYLRAHDNRGAMACTGYLGRLTAHQGEMVTAIRLLRQAESGARVVDDDYNHAAILRDLAYSHHFIGEHGAADELAREAVRRSDALGDCRSKSLARCVLADVILAAGDVDRAEDVCREALRLAQEIGDQRAIAVGLRIAASLITTRYGRVTEAWRRACRSMAAVRRLLADTGVVPSKYEREATRALADEARLRLGDQTFADLWRAGQELSVISAISDALAPVAVPVDPQLANAERRGMTAREYEVAQLVATGLTNREIARRLGIAEWTVVNHMRKIMRKLECSSRVHVANWMARQTTDSGKRESWAT